jgi:endonuclease/exonuclease/phosphatase family metal-dependent hydrolase
MKLVTLNAEGNRHLDRIIPFLEHERPEVICLQEVFERDAFFIAEHLGMSCAFSVMALDTYERRSEILEPIGIAILTDNEPDSIHIVHYKNGDAPVVSYTEGRDRHSLLWVEIEHEHELYVIGTTHLMVTNEGLPTHEQRTAVTNLLKILDNIPEIILCGDFNIPRGINELYNQFATCYTDNIPKDIHTTLDPALHRAGDDPIGRAYITNFVVDYIFTTQTFCAENVRMVSGVSDHCALIAELSNI